MMNFNRKGNWLAFGGLCNFSLLCMGLVLFAMVGCGGGGGGDDDVAASKTWTLSIRYQYYYYPEGDVDEGKLLREEDDNNADGIIDEYWIYYYEDDPNNAGERRLDYYDHYTGQYAIGDQDATGTYVYDSAATGYLLELIHVPVDDDDTVQRWDYTLSDGLRVGYTYYVDDDLYETGTYTYNADNYLIELETSSDSYWLYDVDSDGVRQNYDYYEDGDLVRTGTYVYDDDGKLTRLDSYELQ